MTLSELHSSATACLLVALVGLAVVEWGSPLAVQILGGVMLVVGAFGEVVLSARIVVRRLRRGTDDER